MMTQSQAYYFTDFSHLEAGNGAKTKLSLNKAALRVLIELKQENRTPTDKERDTLAKYSGNGTIASVIDKEYLDLYQQLGIPAPDLNTDNAYQTSPQVIKAIWQVLEQLGFKHGRILEPSCSIGLFPGLMKPDHREK